MILLYNLPIASNTFAERAETQKFKTIFSILITIKFENFYLITQDGRKHSIYAKLRNMQCNIIATKKIGDSKGGR